MPKIESLEKRDFDWVLEHFGAFWEDEATRPRHHPIFLREFGDSAFVMRDGEGVAAYLLGVVATSAPVGYVHLVAVRRDLRRRGLARRLYERFVDHARGRGCRRLKATCDPGNEESIAFHLGLGMEMRGEPADDDPPRVRDYGGPGIDRVVFDREI